MVSDGTEYVWDHRSKIEGPRSKIIDLRSATYNLQSSILDLRSIHLKRIQEALSFLVARQFCIPCLHG